jgi:very-short-patch-repair endonuclease
MDEPFLASAALAAGTLTRHALRTRFVPIHHDVYLAKDTELSAVVRARAAWLRTRGHGVLAGFSASALHGARWIDARRPATVIDSNRRRTRGIEVWAGRLDADEICIVDGMRVTTPLRTAVDLARHCSMDTAVAAIDALARAKRLEVGAMMAAANRPGRHGMKRARGVIELVDPGAESPKETWLRLVIVRAGFPRPETQVPIHNEYGVLIGEVDLGWRNVRIAVEYEGVHHRMSRAAFDKDIRRIEAMIERGWTVVRITAADTEGTVVRRLSLAWAQRTPAVS